MESSHPFVYYTSIEGIAWTELEKVISSFSNIEKEKVLSLKKDEDRISTVLGRLLLYYMINKLDGSPSLLFPDIGYTKDGRPYIENNTLDFNISHSRDIVACVMYKSSIGIDVEIINEINLLEYLPILTKREFHYLHNHNRQKEEFTKLWTIKESILKADGRGFFANMEKLAVMDNFSILDSQIWYNKSYIIENNYYLSIASKEIVSPIISKINSLKLINFKHEK